KAPAFQFYASDFDSATRSWLPEEVGVYIRLLSSQWITGPLPIDLRRLSLIAGVSKDEIEIIWETVGPKFIKTPDGFINERLEKIRQDQFEFRERQSQAGRKGAEKRWGNKNEK
ncbi:MAG: DUF1376 domain-containing protein, partial [Gammaproteobacteria bacterium]|nr:DUF1376 domain-containing protein [Gammaproteobacteria bacterium]